MLLTLTRHSISCFALCYCYLLQLQHSLQSHSLQSESIHLPQSHRLAELRVILSALRARSALVAPTMEQYASCSTASPQTPTVRTAGTRSDSSIQNLTFSILYWLQSLRERGRSPRHAARPRLRLRISSTQDRRRRATMGHRLVELRVTLSALRARIVSVAPTTEQYATCSTASPQTPTVRSAGTRSDSAIQNSRESL